MWHRTDLRFEGVPMRQAYNVEMSGDWANYLEHFLGNGTLSVWLSANVRECKNEAEQEDEGRQSIAQDILRKGTDFLRRIIVAEGQGGVTLSYVCPHCHPLEDYIWWVSAWHGKKHCNLWCAACGGQLESPKQSLGHKRQHGPPRGKSVSSARCTAKNVRQLDECAQALGKPAEGW